MSLCIWCVALETNAKRLSTYMQQNLPMNLLSFRVSSQKTQQYQFSSLPCRHPRLLHHHFFYLFPMPVCSSDDKEALNIMQVTIQNTMCFWLANQPNKSKSYNKSKYSSKCGKPFSFLVSFWYHVVKQHIENAAR